MSNRLIKGLVISTATRSIFQKLGSAVKEVARTKGSSWWYTSHMAAASRAIAERIPLVDFVLEVRDSRIPLSSECSQLGDLLSSSRRIIVLNKIDLAKQSAMKEWTKYFNQEKSPAFGVNAHNKENIREFLNFLQARARELLKTGHSGQTITLMFVGMPNVGKSALANALHQVGRISALEKGKLKHATVSPQPGETKNISSLKIASHPNIYVLDTPGILPPEIFGDELCSKLACIGAIRDCIVGKNDLAHYFLAVLNLSQEYKKWSKFSAMENVRSSIYQEEELSESSHMDKRQYATDHTQDFIVNDVRRTLFEAVSTFSGDLENDKYLEQLIEVESRMLRNAFRITQSGADGHTKFAIKLLDLCRTGRLGHYVLDDIPRIS
ncbi:DAR GTPase 2, mitochondrial [Coffea eugenioides]|uniref:DAR GTPase 2, mitochondrial n=1 Tax=Coffea eugenioides TaxID=49369 RepID=UPI000F60DC7A|nr:DAR GTPase 2, mitochondrial [Coffea eugenioides]